ncbi:g2479 [Coccomyxa elongata]
MVEDSANTPLLGESGSAIIVLEDASGPGWGPPPQEGATLFQATFNMVNIFMGIGLLSMPFAMKQGGWVGMAALAVATAVFCLSGKLIVRNFEKMPPDTSHTYPALGRLALGKTGFYTVGTLAFTEFFGDSLIVLIVMWQELAAVLPKGGLVMGLSPFHFSVVVCTLATAPLMFIPSFKKLSWLSMLGCISTVLVTITVLAAVAMDPFRQHQPIQPPAGHDVARWGIFESMGIFAVSVSGHSSLPVLRNSMKQPRAFDKVINLAFTAMLIIYGIVAGLGYYYFGDAASTLITDDLARNSPFTGHSVLLPGFTVDKLVALCILVNAYTTYPCLILVIQDMMWSVLPFLEQYGGTRQPRRMVATGVRLLLFVAGTCIAFVAYAILGNVMSLVGGFASISCSLLMPSLFYLILFWKELGIPHRTGVVVLLVVGTALLVLIVGQNVIDIAQKVDHDDKGVKLAQSATSVLGRLVEGL